jgi:predicted nuclease of predicted toxin-antitoxin system
MDAHVPAAISSGLRQRGIDVLTSQEDGSNRLPDDVLFQRAISLGRVLFSQDDDMLTLAARYQQQGTQFTGVVYAHQLSAGIGTLVKDLELVLTCCNATELANRVTYLPLK